MPVVNQRKIDKALRQADKVAYWNDRILEELCDGKVRQATIGRAHKAQQKFLATVTQ